MLLLNFFSFSDWFNRANLWRFNRQYSLYGKEHYGAEESLSEFLLHSFFNSFKLLSCTLVIKKYGLWTLFTAKMIVPRIIHAVFWIEDIISLQCWGYELHNILRGSNEMENLLDYSDINLGISLVLDIFKITCFILLLKVGEDYKKLSWNTSCSRYSSFSCNIVYFPTQNNGCVFSHFIFSCYYSRRDQTKFRRELWSHFSWF